MEVEVVVTAGKVFVEITVDAGSVRVDGVGVIVLYLMTGVVVVMNKMLERITGGKVVVLVTTCGGRVTAGPGTVLYSVTLDTTEEVTVYLDV